MTTSRLIPDPIHLWTCQHPAVWELLKSGGTYRTAERLAAPHFFGDNGQPDAAFEMSYDWISGQLAKRSPRPNPNLRWPVWADWSRGPEGPGRPDLRRVRPIKPGVMLELQISSQRVLLNDGMGWYSQLNQTWNGRGHDKYFDAIDAMGPSDVRARRRLEQRMKKTWRRSLAVNPARYTEAVFWELRPEDVVRHWHYKGWPATKY